MANQYGGPSRSDRYNKKRKNTKAITYLSIIGGILIIVLLAIFIIGGNDGNDNDNEIASNNNTNESNSNEEDRVIFNNSEQDDTNGQEDSSSGENEPYDDNPSEEQNQIEETNQEIETYEVSSEDENVRAAYEGNWKPIGTTQEEPHTIQFDDESVDWKEMLQAVEYATGVAVDNQTVNWIGRAGEQAVSATITSNSNPDSIYRVQLQWIEDKGWQPTLLEELVEYKQEN